jgi:hypothetical protein
MTMKLDENTRGIWYCQTIPEEQDFLLTLSRIEEEHYEIVYRFRYYNSDDPFDEKDIKSWYRAEGLGKEEEIIKSINEMLTKLSSISYSEAGFTEILRGDRPFDDFKEEFLQQSFVHAKVLH